MKKFLGVTKVCVLMVVVMVLSGCAGTIKLTETTFKSAPNPDVVFIIEDKHFSDLFVVGTTVEISSINEISKAINTVFKDKAVAIYSHNKPVPEFLNRKVNIVKITPVEFNLYGLPFFWAGKFSADTSINGETKQIEAREMVHSTPFSTGVADAKRLTGKLFLDFAQKIREELKM